MTTTSKKRKAPSIKPGGLKLTPAAAKDARKKKDRAAAEKDAPAQIAKVPKPADVGYWSPSSANVLAACPSWIGEPREDQDTTAADEGSLQHEACEKEDLSKLATDEQRANVQMCLDYVAQFVKTKDYRHTEMKLPIVIDPRAKARNGIIDRVQIHQDKTADIFDFKFGRGEITEAEMNRQGWCYAIMVLDHFPNLQMVRLHFLQPKRDEISTFEFDRKRAAFLLETMRAEYQRTQVPAAKRAHIFGDHCTYCGRKAVCPAMAVAASSIAENYDIDGLPTFALRPSEVTDPAAFSKMFFVAKIMDRWASSVKEHTKQFLLAGHDIPGLKLVEKSGSASIARESVPIVYKVVVEDLKKLDKEQFLLCTDLNYNRLLDAVAEGRQDATKVKAELSNELAELGVVVYGMTSFYPSKE